MYNAKKEPTHNLWVFFDIKVVLKISYISYPSFTFHQTTNNDMLKRFHRNTSVDE